jgi:endoglucanase
MRFTALLSLTLAGCLGHLAAADLISDGGFAGDGAAAAWNIGTGVEIGTDPASRFMHLEVKEPGKLVTAYQLVPVNGIKALRLSYRARWSGVKRGTSAWFDARVMMTFKDKDKKGVKGSPSAPYYTGSSDGWQPRVVDMLVPDDAAYLEIMPCLFNAKAGSFDLDDISLVAIDPGEIPPKKAKEPQKESKVDAGGPQPQALHVDGNRILRQDGSEVWLQGASVDSLQWSNTGEDIVNSVIAAIDEWKANVIRLPMNEERWFGQASGQTDNGAAYRSIIDTCVKAASSRGAYLILDLHRFRAPKEEHVVFWKDAANTYKDNPAVIFELFNEPHDLSWELWRDGGEVSNKRKEGDALAENKDAVTSFKTTGMQALVDAVRSTGAKNLVLAGGLDWSYDISGVLNGFALKDQEGVNGIAYVAHCYPWKSGWQKRWLDVAKVHPVVMTEVGCDAVRYSFIPPERHENPYTWAPDMIACIQKNRIHWTAFSFHRSCGPPMLMKGDGYVPTPFWGAFVRAALSGAQFTSDRLR